MLLHTAYPLSDSNVRDPFILRGIPLNGLTLSHFCACF